MASQIAISNVVDHAKFRSRSHDVVIRVYDEAGNVIETHQHPVDSKSRETDSSRNSFNYFPIL
jgi:hypothetical protein